MVTENTSGPIDCACVIHGDAYSWEYVDRLYKMLSRNSSREIRLHVYTEKTRPVPEPFIKHELTDWGIVGPKKSWWYKVQLFNNQYHQGPLLYFDLDIVVVNNIDWMFHHSLQSFWTVRDFKHLWNASDFSINSSIMYFDTTKFSYVWDDFISRDFNNTLLKYRGDQNYLTEVIRPEKRKYFDQERIKSWRWECFDGGYNFIQKRHINIGKGTSIPPQTSVLIFHGHPKPGDLKDPVVNQYWQ